MTLPLEPGPLVAQELIRDELQVVVSSADELARRPKLEPADLHGRRIVTLRRDRATAVVLARLEAQEIRPEIVYRSDDTGTLIGLVRSGATAALLPALAADAATRDLVVRSFDPPVLHRRIGIAWRREHPPTGTAAELVDVVRAALARWTTITAAAS